MRVIGGEFRSRVLKSLPGTDVRPTPDRLREALFSILAPRIEDTIFADLFAGTGAVGIEALSRGAARAIFVETNRAAVQVIRANLKSLDLDARSQILQLRASRMTPGVWGDIVFMDPPYGLEREYSSTLELLGGQPPKLVIVQHDVRLKLAESYGGLSRMRELRQSDNVLSFYEISGC
jgi:16S rRNA (guanine966-N2)-methyltransferase